MIVFTAVSVIAGIMIYAISQRTRRGLSDEELIARGAAEREVAEDLPPG
jgi:hypothetical protein